MTSLVLSNRAQIVSDRVCSDGNLRTPVCDVHTDIYLGLTSSLFKDGLPYLFHSFRNKYFNKISLGNMLYF